MIIYLSRLVSSRLYCRSHDLILTNDWWHSLAASDINNDVTWSLSLSPFKRPFSRWTWVSRYQNAPPFWILLGAKSDGGGSNNWSYKACKAAVKCHHQHANSNTQLFYRPHVTNNVKALTTGHFLYFCHITICNKKWVPCDMRRKQPLYRLCLAM